MLPIARIARVSPWRRWWASFRAAVPRCACCFGPLMFGKCWPCRYREHEAMIAHWERISSEALLRAEALWRELRELRARGGPRR